MKRVLFILAILVAVPLHEAAAKVYKVKDVPMVHLVDRTRYVSNPDNILSSGIVAEMDRMLYALEEQTGIQVLVVVLTDIEGGDCFDFAYRLGGGMIIGGFGGRGFGGGGLSGGSFGGGSFGGGGAGSRF